MWTNYPKQQKRKSLYQGYKKITRGNRDKYYEECQPYYQTLKSVVDALDQAEVLINQKIIETEENDRKQTRRFITMISFTFLGIVVSVLASLLTIIS